MLLHKLDISVVKQRRLRRIEENPREEVRHPIVRIHLNINTSILQRIGVSKGFVAQDVHAADLNH